MDRTGLFAAAAAALIATCFAIDAKADDDEPGSVRGKILRTVYDGVSDDLLTGGLGAEGLAFAASPPGFADPENPTAAERRRLAIYSNYRALVDTSESGGYGTLYGPNVTADGTATTGRGLIAGVEFIAFSGLSRENVTMMVQVPADFDATAPCIVTAPSSGSRGVYGAIGTAGEWGLKNRCAVAYTDKGTGMGVHDLQDNTVGLITGARANAKAAGKRSNFTAPISDRKRRAFNAAWPDRFAWKHAHSRLNPEKDWGRDVLRSIEFAFFVLNEEFGADARGGDDDDDDDDDGGRRFTPNNTIVIASSVSNGGGSSILAAEQDHEGLIDGIAVSEPNVNPRFDPGFVIVQENDDPVVRHSRSLYDYTTLLNLYQGCANLDPAIAGAPFNFVDPALGANRCASLREKDLLESDDPAAQAAESQSIINAFGILTEQNILQPSHWFLNVPQAIGVTYAKAYGRASVTNNLCAYSFGATQPVDNQPTELSEEAEAALFSVANGIPPTGGVNIINNASVGGPLLDRESTSPSSDRKDQNLDGALCLRALEGGADPVTGARLRGFDKWIHKRLRRSIRQIRATGDLRRKPTLIVTGRADAILPPNHTSRAYFGLNRRVEGTHGRLRYYEVLNAQHLDALNAFGGFNERYIPLHHYFIQALDLMLDHLRNGTPLPPSQVVRTTPRGTGAPPISLDNLPDIAANPEPGSRIVFTGRAVLIPE